MITPLGPRGSIGVSRPMGSPSLAPLELMVEVAKTSPQPIRYSETAGKIWTEKRTK
jgi:hypothetical protein